ncbi:hypothetical protein BPAE_0087g00390 [Botrytis paeoniae]|uniref:Uncharacterized protein n=1 Tax=Botrytis paeoniae TaxID=278948 RepID=A0A4Z1FQI7_9HELO|nr:hypothetical protein BPAE_0087g00390 [Botrytis paeoniae]
MSLKGKEVELPREVYHILRANCRMTPEDKALYERIATFTDPKSVTRAEKNQLFGLPPSDEEDRLCLEKIGLTVSEPNDKIMISSDTLSQLEVTIAMFGVTHVSGNLYSGKRDLLWYIEFEDEEKELVRKIHDFLENRYDIEMKYLHQKRSEYYSQIREQQREKREQACNDYWERTDEKWRVFRGTYNMTADIVLSRSWRQAFFLIETHRSRFVSDPLLDEASIDDLRQRFVTMRERGEFANGRATDCFLVVDDTVLDHDVISLKTSYKPKRPGKPDPWESTLSIRAVDPDYNNAVSMRSESNTSGFPGEITIPISKVFDWLYYSSMSKSEDWETR